MQFDRVAILDWSAAGSPCTGKDSIWLGVTCAAGTTAQNLPTRVLAEAALISLAEDCLIRGERLLLGADFNFGAPAGLAAALTGRAEALAWWDWLTQRVHDTDRNQTNYRHIAAQMNGHFQGGGPFWGNGAKQEVAGLPRTKPGLPKGLAEHRHTDLIGRTGGLYPKPIWQLAGAGAVGAQSLTGIPVLWRLRQRLGRNGAVWPFEAPDAPIVLAEIYASHVTPLLGLLEKTGMVRDEEQVRLMSLGLYTLAQTGHLGPFFHSDPLNTRIIDEGWTFGTGHVDALQKATVTGLTT